MPCKTGSNTGKCGKQNTSFSLKDWAPAGSSREILRYVGSLKIIHLAFRAFSFLLLLVLLLFICLFVFFLTQTLPI